MYLPHITAEFANNHDLASRPVPAASWRSTSCHRPPWPIGLFCHRGKTHYALQNQSPTYAAQIFGRFQFPTPIPSYTLHRIAAGGALQAVVPSISQALLPSQGFFLGKRAFTTTRGLLAAKNMRAKKKETDFRWRKLAEGILQCCCYAYASHALQFAHVGTDAFYNSASTLTFCFAPARVKVKHYDYDPTRTWGK